MPFVDGPRYKDKEVIDYDAKEALPFNNEVVENLWSLDMSTQCQSVGEISNTQVIKQSIRNILFTVPTERLFNLQFGINLYQYIFENYAAIDGLKKDIVSTLQTYEPRITINVRDIEVSVTPEEHSVKLDMTYYIKDSKTIDTLNETLFL